jgi:hypothetical protein
MERTGDFHHHIFKFYTPISENIFDDTTSLNTRKYMLNNHS